MTLTPCVHCLGVGVVDLLCGPIGHYPIPRQRSQVVTEFARLAPGGGAVNTALALESLGIPAAVFVKIGADALGRILVEALQKRGVDTGGVIISDPGTTPVTFVGVHPGGDRTFIHTPGTNRTFSPADLDLTTLFRAPFLLYQDFWVLPKLDGPPAADLLAAARRQGIRTLLDECWGFGPDRQRWECVVPHADYLLPSYDDLLAIYPGLDPYDMIRCLREKGAQRIVLKMGARGCLVATGERLTVLPSHADKIVDPTGAGDCFDAGFIAGLVRGMDEVSAAVLGSLCAAACLRHVGGAEGIPPLEELQRQMDRGD